MNLTLVVKKAWIYNIIEKNITATMKISIIVTVFNEEKTIENFLGSIKKQTLKPNEVIIVDGGSSDFTYEKILKYKKNNKLNIRLLQKKGNRSVGRNFAIKNSKNQVIAITDAGCVLDKNWLKNISEPFKDKSVDVVAGYYKGKPKNIFEKSILPYVLVMPDKTSSKFLPATRSIAIRKKYFQKVGKFNEKLNHNEDYEFAKRLEKNNANIFFQKTAFVFWEPVQNLKKAFRMFYRFAMGDVESKILRPKVTLIFLRYFYFIYLIFIFGIYKNLYSALLIFGSFGIYVIWTIWKNYKYVNNVNAFFYLPVIQFISDIAVMSGSFSGLLKLLLSTDYLKLVKSNFGLILILPISTFLVFFNFS